MAWVSVHSSNSSAVGGPTNQFLSTAMLQWRHPGEIYTAIVGLKSTFLAEGIVGVDGGMLSIEASRLI